MLAARAQPIVAEIYKRGTVKGRTGKIYQLHSAIDATEGSFISQLIDGDQTIHDTLEIGCAYGLSSLHICLATKGRSNASHTMIDPFQSTQWDGAGVVNLEQAGIDFFHLIEEKSEFALPRLLESSRQFDFIFVDGMHTFDHAMLDCFYATRLLRVGGYLVIDDAHFHSLRRVVSFFANYPCYRIHGSVSDPISITSKKKVARTMMSPLSRASWARILRDRVYRGIFDDRLIRMIALKKIAEDDRNWDWHDDRF